MPGQGTLPLPVGAVIKPERLTPDERQQLEAMGWQPGQAVPANLPELIAQVQAAAAPQPHESPLPLDHPQLPPLESQLKRLDELSVDRQAQLSEAIRLANEQAKFLEQSAAQQAAIDSASVQQALRGAQGLEPMAVIDDLSSGQAPADVSAGPASRAGVVAEERCPNCGHQLANPPASEPTVDEKRAFLQSLLGMGRFYAERVLLGGSVKVRYRSLSSLEADEIYNQIGHDLRAGKLQGDSAVLLAAADYRFCLSVDAVAVSRGVNVSVPTWDAWSQSAPAEQRQLSQYREHVYAKLLPVESLRRVLAREFDAFQRLLSRLEANADNPDFWQGIA